MGGAILLGQPDHVELIVDPIERDEEVPDALRAGMLARLTSDERALAEVAFSMVRHDERNATYVCDPGRDKEAVEQIMRQCDTLGTTLTISGSEMVVWKKP